METINKTKKVTVKIIQKYRTGFDKHSDGSTLYTGCKQVFQAPTNQYDRLIPLLTEEEQREYEGRMGLAKGDLAFNNKDKSFWSTFKVTLDKKGKTFDLSDPEDYLAYKVLMASNTVANSKEAINVLQHTFFIETDEEQLEDNTKIADRFEEANALFLGLSKSNKKMTNILRLMGKIVEPNPKTAWLKAEIIKMIEQKAKITGQNNIDDFIKTASDPDIDTKVFILDAIEIGEVIVDGTTYKLRSGDLIGYDFIEAVKHFNNPKNQQSKLIIEDRIKTNKKE